MNCSPVGGFSCKFCSSFLFFWRNLLFIILGGSLFPAVSGGVSTSGLAELRENLEFLF